MSQAPKKRRGRPFLYLPIIQSLNDEQVYSPASIVDHAEANEFFDPNGIFKKILAATTLFVLKRRIRTTLGRLSNNHHFPKLGDGWVIQPNQTPVPGWFGKRWKQTCGLLESSQKGN